MKPIINVSGVTKSYDQQLFNNVSFDIYPGEVVGLIGNNGVGKTTLMKIILGLGKADEGTISLNGDANYLNVKHNQKISYLMETPLYEYLTAYETIKYFGLFKDLHLKDDDIKRILNEVGLDSAINKKVSDFSFGMRQRLRLALSLLNDCDFLILDEPTLGMDYSGVQEFNEMILEIAKTRNIAILISSHQMENVAKICGRFLFLKDGTISESVSLLQTKYVLKLKRQIPEQIINNFVDYGVVGINEELNELYLSGVEGLKQFINNCFGSEVIVEIKQETEVEYEQHH